MTKLLKDIRIHIYNKIENEDIVYPININKNNEIRNIEFYITKNRNKRKLLGSSFL